MDPFNVGTVLTDTGNIEARHASVNQNEKSSIQETPEKPSLSLLFST